jgi:hypothetical protein
MSIGSIPSLHRGHPLQSSILSDNDDDDVVAKAAQDSKAQLLAQYEASDAVALAWLQQTEREESYSSLPQDVTCPSIVVTETTEASTAVEQQQQTS